MKWQLSRSRRQARPAVSWFRPTLEALEGREVPSVAPQVNAALMQLPGAVTNLQNNANSTNLSIVMTDLKLLEQNTASFVLADRLMIDTALETNGTQLVFHGFTTFLANNPQIGFSELGAGFGAFVTGIVDSALAPFQNTGTLTLTGP